MREKINDIVSEYYSRKIETYGSNFSGVDWNSKESQYLRFDKLCSCIDIRNKFSILDFGCGYGELVFYLNNKIEHNSFQYLGYDLSQKMIDAARDLHVSGNSLIFSTCLPDQRSDYVVASGVFNVKLDSIDDEIWKEYILNTLKIINQLSVKAFSFNLLTSYSDKEYMKEYLYYANPTFFFDYCKRFFSKNVSLLHDYGLYEFTIIVLK